jgi:serine phosphatase RsbU (regulator of sigma subunit)
MRSALIAAMCVGVYRHDRRANRGIEQIHESLDDAVSREFGDLFATGQLATVALDSGVLSWTNAGHPLPMLVRGGQVIKELSCAPTPPWGMGGLEAGKVSVATEALEPGDSVLFYTDGVVEAHLPGAEQFGFDRLADLVGQQAGNRAEPEEVLRRIVRAVLEHQDDRLADDATIVIFNWDGPQ